MKKLNLEEQSFSKEQEVHVFLKACLGFPNYYGNNLDALYDMLSELSEQVTVCFCFRGTEEKGGILQKFLPVFLEACEENPWLQVVVEWEGEVQ